MSPPSLRPYPSVSICAPAYNEAENIDAFLDECWEALEGAKARAKLDYQLVIVDDGSKDATWERLQARAAQWPQLQPVRHPQNAGIAAALATAAEHATKDYVFIIGSDGQWLCADLWDLLEAYRRGADIVVGDRRNRAEVYTLYRRFVSASYRWGVRMLFGVDLHDAGSLKLGPRALFSARLTSRSVFADAERLIRGVRSGLTIAFVPCHFLPRRAGVATGARTDVVLRAAQDLVRSFVAIRIRGE